MMHYTVAHYVSSYCTQSNISSSREVRKIWTSTKFVEYMSIPYVAQAFTIQRTRTIIKTGKTTTETVYGITSRSPQKATPEQILATNRGHWAIENRSHYVRDVTYDEDRSQIRAKNGPQVMATLRNLGSIYIKVRNPPQNV
ncbi:MAG: hypothetical protein HQL69_12345 [Magnetococcales bacterium]|nr:hypothetical protein [Magnetococcales bacterium]